ncbi:P-loop containing nucleoside triphosphate hydrolase protein [Amanita rubescens]|nr:P-loop containing nucleoside triphosphate hydrolase protein [Amanita rubescens]
MRQSSALVVETTTTTTPDDLPYDLELSRRISVYTTTTEPDVKSIISAKPIPSASLLREQHPLKPSIRLLFSSVLVSIIAGGVAPFMTYVIGQVFDAFSQFQLTSNPSTEAKENLLHGVGLAALELIALACRLTSCIWIWIGETNAMAVRKRVYLAVTQKEMAWFDTKMGADDTMFLGHGDEQHGPVGAGGLMANFARETDDVRMATSLASGMLVQYITTSITCLALAFTRFLGINARSFCPQSQVLIFIQGLSQSITGPLLAQEHVHTANAATLVDRAIASIATVKAFNAVPHEILTAVWGLTSGLAQFVMMSMFVQGFWFGSKLVRSGKVSAGDVMAVFWACLIATSNLQLCIPQFIVLAKGKHAIASLLTLAGNDQRNNEVLADSTATAFISTNSIYSQSRRSSHSARRGNRPLQPLRKITPARCTGEFSLHGVTFAYPSRPDTDVLTDISIYLPANETTFIVGASGSGKSTIAQLLLRMYHPREGAIQLDDQDIRYIDEAWMRRHISGVRQGECVIKRLWFHEFVRDLPDGYETHLGRAGYGLSGGQRQRLALARARLRNPSVLILDEATSALDATSRLLVFEALKRWRTGKTTIVITHDLSQIEAADFVYVLKEGQIVEQGFRSDLENPKCREESEFCSMLEAQMRTGGYLPEKNLDEEVDAYPVELPDSSEEESADIPFRFKHHTLRRATVSSQLDPPADAGLKRISRFVPPEAFKAEMKEDKDAGFEDRRQGRKRPASITVPSFALPAVPSAVKTAASRRLSLQFSPTSPCLYRGKPIHSSTRLIHEDQEFENEKDAIERSKFRPRARWDDMKVVALGSVKVDSKPVESEESAIEQRPRFWSLIRSVFPTIPYKPAFFLGLFVCLASGAMTPIFSFLLSRLIFEVSIGAGNAGLINIYGGIVLSAAALDGLLIGSKYFVMESTGMAWVTRMRKRAFGKILAQDKKFFDKEENSPGRLVQILIKDGDDARNLVSVVIGQYLVVSAMLGVGMIWALVSGWQLTLAGVAIAPVFAGVMAIQSILIARCELRNKRAREEVAQCYYDAISNIRAIRSMSLESAFKARFEDAANVALVTGLRGAMVEGCAQGVASGLIYLAEALLFYVGAVLVAKGSYTYLRMVEVLNLVVFSVTIGSQLMAFTQKIEKSIQAAGDFDKLLKLSSHTEESRGVLRPAVTGPVDFANVGFAYTERAAVPVLKDISLRVMTGECVAIVGPSGSGKSTIAALLQRLYEPQFGVITLGGIPLHTINVEHLREHVSVVSQNPNLFDASIAENIRYGNNLISDADIEKAAKAAHVHEFIMSLPEGYNTLVGENAALISGGQAQRIQIARALARPASILILDECTSALDPTNQAAVLETIRDAKRGRTTIMITHKMTVMQMCDRIILVDGGQVKEEGTYKELMELRGHFATLAKGGEWLGD